MMMMTMIIITVYKHCCVDFLLFVSRSRSTEDDRIKAAAGISVPIEHQSTCVLLLLNYLLLSNSGYKFAFRLQFLAVI